MASLPNNRFYFVSFGFWPNLRNHFPKGIFQLNLDQSRQTWKDSNYWNNHTPDTLGTKDSGREGPACRVISCRMERGMNYCVCAHLRQLIAISRHFWSVLKRSRHAASESHADMADAAEFNMIVSKFLTRQKAKIKQQSKAKQSKRKKKQTNTNKTKHLLTKQKTNKQTKNTNKTNHLR